MLGWSGCDGKGLLLVTVAVTAMSVAGIATAQSPTVPAPSFEVASVRQVSRGSGYTSISPLGSARFFARNASMKLLIEMAFGVQGYQIAGKNVGWIDSELYDIEAKPQGDVSLSYEQLKPLLQHLLAQRFKLEVHHEQKEIQGYALKVAKNGSKLQVGKEATGMGYILSNGIRGPAVSMSSLAAMLAHPVGTPVVDKTGVTGKYSIKLNFAPDGSADSPYPSIFTALQEQLGLKLEPQKVAVEMLVIDRLDKVPSAN
ncbi:TIGR03435 family protein [Edaphobacter sp.]|uniref:TIGR03435 family protein n=1 Tax=Edaphobacter sp. TaxID=1934404 RepID=UPI002DB9D82B|nr:TIGR03435 family protein [Edaphobacter sp.]HEU5342534.1 TIGR03435 family protein [Edaphobacter sp.]